MTARARTKGSAPVVVTGTPRKLTATVPGDRAPAIDPTAPVDATLDGATIDSITFEGPRRSDPDGLRVKLRLDPLTPPGRYEGTAKIDGVRIPLVAEVQPWVAIRHEPRIIVLDAAPADAIEVPLTIRNIGNVPTDVPDVSQFVLLDRSGFSDAFYRAVSADLPKDERRVDVLFDDLAASSGGAVTVTAKREGAWPLQPGETGTVIVTLAFGQKLRPGAQYTGAWDVEATHVPVRITVPPAPVDAPAPSAPAPGKRATPSTTKPRAARRRKETPPS